MKRTPFLMVLTMVSFCFFAACQPADDTEQDTDTLPDCAESETAVVLWCTQAEDTGRAFWCENCDDSYSCENPDSSKDGYRTICDIAESHFGNLRDCVDSTKASQCLASFLALGCDDYLDGWINDCESITE